MKKIVQIVAADSPDQSHWPTLYALCEDGTVWMLVHRAGSDGLKWVKIEAVPVE